MSSLNPGEERPEISGCGSDLPSPEPSRRDGRPKLEDPPEPSRRAAQHKLKAPPDKLGAETHELGAPKTAERRATADARLRWHHDNYRSLAEAQRSQWPQWLEALKKEYGCLISEGLFGEVGRSTVPETPKWCPHSCFSTSKRMALSSAELSCVETSP